MRRWKDWLRQAKRKLESAQWDLQGGFFEDACFSAQQAAELSVKALLEAQGVIKRGHSILALLKDITVDDNLLEAARILDQYYIPTRYPNGFDMGAPMDFYTEKQAKEAIAYARSILGFVENEIGQISAGE
jgi:HEPN domain-containing protein